MVKEPELKIIIEVFLDDVLWIKEKTSLFEVAEMKLDSFRRQYEKKLKALEKEKEGFEVMSPKDNPSY